MTDSKKIDETPVQLLFATYQSLVERLDRNSRLWTFQYDLYGLEQCIRFGPNVDNESGDRQKTQNYYGWSAWKNHSMSLRGKTREDFLHKAQCKYISLVHQYLCLLNYYPVSSFQLWMNA